MPAGKLGISGTPEWRSWLPYKINVRSLRCRAKAGALPLTIQEVRQIRSLLRNSIWRYRNSHKTGQPTATERRKTLRKIRTAAARFAATGKRSWANKLLDQIEAAELDVIQILMDQVNRIGQRWSPMKKNLQLTAAVSTIKADACLPGVYALAAMDVGALVPKEGRWRDPALATMVAALEPSWRRITGRTAGLVSVDKGIAKDCPFAHWLGDMIEAVGGQRPAVSRVADIVCSLESDRAKFAEIKKSGTRHRNKVSP